MIKMALLVGACFLVSGASVFGILFKSTKDFEGSLAMGLCIGFSYAMVCFSISRGIAFFNCVSEK